jgi:hypothetical protein
VTDDPHEIGSLRARAKKEQPKQDEPKNKAEVLAVTWGLTQGDPAPYREAAIWWLLRSRKDKRLKGVVDEWGERHKEATGSDRDPWNRTLKAAEELEKRGIKALAAIVRRYIAGETPSDAVQTELDRIVAVNGPADDHT